MFKKLFDCFGTPNTQTNSTQPADNNHNPAFTAANPDKPTFMVGNPTVHELNPQRYQESQRH